ncbi:MAG: Nif3-like dinuclear metal center hexameric protein [Desulfocapsa sp.]|nr:Nif3-like dinuclear metal center hexameric protein [Desulfocapsa sp.]
MKATVNDILESLGRIAPFELAESWDNVGLLVGDPGRETRALLLGLDPSLALLEEAVSRGADTLITHHPCIFRPFPAVNITTPGGAFLERALSQKINVIACHTNFDNAVEGVSDALAAGLNLTNLRPLRPVNFPGSNNTGLGRIGSYSTPLSFSAFMQQLYIFLAIDTVQIAGTPPQQVKTVALCGGSGSDLAEEALMNGADIYLSAEIKHSTARWAEESGLCIIDGTHYGTEQPAIALLGSKLESQARQAGWEVDIYQTQSEKPAFTFIHKTDFKQ